MIEQTPTTQGDARQYAIDWQNWQPNESLSYSESAEWADHFTTIAEQFDLVDEFEENGII